MKRKNRWRKNYSPIQQDMFDPGRPDITKQLTPNQLALYKQGLVSAKLLQSWIRQRESKQREEDYCKLNRRWA